MYNVYQHWDPLKVMAVGISYPPELYDYIRSLASELQTKLRNKSVVYMLENRFQILRLEILKQIGFSLEQINSTKA
jgi:hypothetical protein